jgi:peptide/nickel transport system permease protein
MTPKTSRGVWAARHWSPTLNGLVALLRSKPFLIGAGTILFWAVCAAFGPELVPYSPYQDDLRNTLAAPSLQHWFGTDQIGRDIFSRIVTGARPILSVAPAATLLAAMAGTALGLVAGYAGGIADTIIRTAIEIILALPLIVVALLVLVAIGPSPIGVMLVIALIFTPLIARTVRAAVLSEMALDYVTAARLGNEPAWAIMVRDILPNILPPIVVEVTVRLGYAIFTVASLSFLGFGIQPPSPDWGLSIAENYGLIVGGYWWTVVFAAAATASLVIAVNLVAESLRVGLE